MKSVSIIYTVLFAFLMTACGYQPAKLKVSNKSEKAIEYTTVLRADDGTCFSNSGGGTIAPGENSRPPVRGSIETSIDSLSVDHILYVVFFDRKDHEDIYAHIGTILSNDKVKVQPYSKEALDKMGWEVVFDGR